MNDLFAAVRTCRTDAVSAGITLSPELPLPEKAAGPRALPEEKAGSRAAPEGAPPLCAASKRPPPQGSPDSRVAEARFCFPEDFIGFAGHFPGDPILPGIAQIMAAVCAAEREEPAYPALRAVKLCKFLSPVRPGQEVLVRAELALSDADEKVLHVRAELSAAGTPCASMRLVLGAAHPSGRPGKNMEETPASAGPERKRP